MSASRLAGCIGVLLGCWPAVGTAQPPASVASEIERIAVTAAVERAGLRGGGAHRVVIDPMTVHPDEAPGFRDKARRDSTRQESLRHAFGAASRRRMEVIGCEQPPCLPDIDVLVTLSDPRITGDSATVTVTTLRYRPHARSNRTRTQYITTGFVLRRESGRWTIVKIRDLGVS